jgi:hypothetical protein
MSKYPLKRELPNKNLSFQIAKFPYNVDFGSFHNPTIRKKTSSDEAPVEDIKEEIKRGSKMAGHIGTSDKKYFGDRRSEKKEKETFILDTKVTNKPLFEGVYTESERNTCYYAFVMIDEQFYAIPVHENWLHFKPLVKAQVTLTTEQAEGLMAKEKEKQDKLMEKIRIKEEEDNFEYSSRTGIKLEDRDLDDDDAFGDDEEEDADDDKEFKDSVKTNKELKKQALGETGKKLKKLLDHDSDKEEEEDEKSQGSDTGQKSPTKSAEKKKRKKEPIDMPPEKKVKVEVKTEIKEEVEPLDDLGQILSVIDKYILENKPTTANMQNRIKLIIKDKPDSKKLRDSIVAHLKITTQTILNDKKEKIIVKK